MALDAIDNIAFERRTASVMTMAVDPRKLPLARRMIEEFAVDLCRALATEPMSDVYNLTISLHSIIKGEVP